VSQRTERRATDRVRGRAESPTLLMTRRQLKTQRSDLRSSDGGGCPRSCRLTITKGFVQASVAGHDRSWCSCSRQSSLRR
jgi:hypothetical protein